MSEKFLVFGDIKVEKQNSHFSKSPFAIWNEGINERWYLRHLLIEKLEEKEKEGFQVFHQLEKLWSS